eukprot:gb/GFBE01024685.1/.p1 GENE.gb/GFBE01024685.1/~~gb/GFBE01024685.1/.p1  ORF type:complete len:508 (+),score=89.79 gb/GFBE01024685.1/:1-1524(+)
MQQQKQQQQQQQQQLPPAQAADASLPAPKSPRQVTLADLLPESPPVTTPQSVVSMTPQSIASQMQPYMVQSPQTGDPTPTQGGMLDVQQLIAQMQQATSQSGQTQSIFPTMQMAQMQWMLQSQMMQASTQPGPELSSESQLPQRGVSPPPGLFSLSASITPQSPGPASAEDEEYSSSLLTTPTISREGQTPNGTPDHHKLDSAEKAGKKDNSGGNSTSLIIRNLPEEYNQQSAMDLFDSYGYRDLYDCFLWFPAKRNATNTGSTVFINFRQSDQARRFRRQFHAKKLKDAGQPLNVTKAHVQGFTDNYIRYWHLTQQGLGSSVCSPYFAKDMLDKVTPEQQLAARRTMEKMQPGTEDGEWIATTLVIRNLPSCVESQYDAIKWLDSVGFGVGYDFLLFVPRKATAPKAGTRHAGLAYLFVNYLDRDRAKACAHGLSALTPGEGELNLSVVPSRIQGYKSCISHFKNVAEGGRLIPCIKSPRTIKEELAKAKAREDLRNAGTEPWAYQ